MTSVERDAARKRRIVVMGLGGTIAASAPGAGQTRGYTLTGTLASVLDQVPQLATIAEIESESIACISSQEVDNVLLLQVARAVQARLDDASVHGVVITHGTDTLEETAFFLSLITRSAKPVVLTGAMRPASALSADGPLNLLHAVKVASDEGAQDRGVMVVMDEQIISAQAAAKLHTSATSAFSHPPLGCLGSVSSAEVVFRAVPSRPEANTVDLAGEPPRVLPQVDIVYGHQHAGEHFYRSAIAAGARGIVFAGTGNGTFSAAAKAGASMAREHGVAFVRSSRVPFGTVSPCEDDIHYGAIAAHSLNPQKARILLMLGLARGMDTASLRQCFEVYG
ncbi:asparaginase [Caballeronia sp. LZ035]|uniref:asparaginase n=1 Tax=Caballeronia sp. LZ035 TaxID=3038568 RepID=UPI002864AEE2|nr:asparaginase [Caballeronia sp. LZ035]MDR5761042.1 asparaginase [Caballeronia sp. LZ035]